MRIKESFTVGLLCVIVSISGPSFASITNEAGKIDKSIFVYVNPGFSYNYPYGADFCLEIASTERQMKGLILRIGAFKNTNSYGIDYLFHNGRYGVDSWWIYRGVSLFENDQKLYVGFPMGIQSNWGGFVEVFPTLGISGSYLMIRSGVKANFELIKAMWDILASIPLASGF